MSGLAEFTFNENVSRQFSSFRASCIQCQKHESCSDELRGNDQASCHCSETELWLHRLCNVPGLNLYFKPKFFLLGFIHLYYNNKTL